MKASALIKDPQTEDGPRGARGGQGGDGEGETLKANRANRRRQISAGEQRHEEEMPTAARMKIPQIWSKVGRSGLLNAEQSETSAVSVAAHLAQLSLKYHRDETMLNHNIRGVN